RIAKSIRVERGRRLVTRNCSSHLTPTGFICEVPRYFYIALMPQSVPSVLLVEDDDDERFLAERTLTRAGVRSLIHIPNGLQAKTFLETQAANKDPQMPDIVLMDLK